MREKDPTKIKTPEEKYEEVKHLVIGLHYFAGKKGLNEKLRQAVDDCRSISLKVAEKTLGTDQAARETNDIFVKMKESIAAEIPPYEQFLLTLKEIKSEYEESKKQGTKGGRGYKNLLDV